MNRWPLRTRLTFWSVLMGAVSLLVFGAAVGVFVERAMLARLDSKLREDAEDMFEALSEVPGPVDWDSRAAMRIFFNQFASLYGHEVEHPPGTIAFRSQALKNVRIPKGPDEQPYTAVVGDNNPVRVLQVTRDSVVLRIAADVSAVRDFAQILWRTCAIVVPATLVLIGLGANWLTGRALRPVEKIVATVERITVDRLAQQLPASRVNDEIGRLTTVINRMLDRMRRSFEQSRRFSADASHELKTPLTILRGEIEIALGSGTLTPDVEKTMLNLLDETGHLMHIVDDLLLLSQADAGKLEIGDASVDLGSLIDELADDIEILAGPLAIRVEKEIAPRIAITGSDRLLRRLLLNLFDNALKHNVRDGRVRAALVASGSRAVFTIASTGPDIPPAERERIFDRFHRVSSVPGTERPEGGQGLGLSICREIAAAHGGALTLEASDPGWTKFQVSVPLREPAPAGRPDARPVAEVSAC